MASPGHGRVGIGMGVGGGEALRNREGKSTGVGKADGAKAMKGNRARQEGCRWSGGRQRNK